jgi:hypothetical protein
MNKYSFENEVHFVLDDNSDNVSSFTTAALFLKEKMNIIPEKFKPPFWDSGVMDFKLRGINLSLFYHDMGGTEIIVKDEDISNDDLIYIQTIVEEIYKSIHDN